MPGERREQNQCVALIRRTYLPGVGMIATRKEMIIGMQIVAAEVDRAMERGKRHDAVLESLSNWAYKELTARKESIHAQARWLVRAQQ